MAFNYTFPEWKNKGTAPSEALRNAGYQKGEQPPADVFNWFWAQTMAAITELQEKVAVLENSSSGGTLTVIINKVSDSNGLAFDLYINGEVVKSISPYTGADGGTFTYENVTSASIKSTSEGAGYVKINGNDCWNGSTPIGTVESLPTSGSVTITANWMD